MKVLQHTRKDEVRYVIQVGRKYFWLAYTDIRRAYERAETLKPVPEQLVDCPTKTRTMKEIQ